MPGETGVASAGPRFRRHGMISETVGSSQDAKALAFGVEAAAIRESLIGSAAATGLRQAAIALRGMQLP